MKLFLIIHLFDEIGNLFFTLEPMIEELTGRAGKTETRTRYSKGYRVQTLYEECILKLDYELDLSELDFGELIP